MKMRIWYQKEYEPVVPHKASTVKDRQQQQETIVWAGQGLA
jgi:hypothetical protein